MEGHRVSCHRLVLITPGIGPWNWQLNFLIAGCNSHFAGQAYDRFCGYTGYFGSPFGGIFLDPVHQ